MLSALLLSLTQAMPATPWPPFYHVGWHEPNIAHHGSIPGLLGAPVANVCVSISTDLAMFPNRRRPSDMDRGASGVLADILRKYFRDDLKKIDTENKILIPRFTGPYDNGYSPCNISYGDIQIYISYDKAPNNKPFTMKFQILQFNDRIEGNETLDLYKRMMDGIAISTSIEEPIDSAISDDIRLHASFFMDLISGKDVR